MRALLADAADSHAHPMLELTPNCIATLLIAAALLRALLTAFAAPVMRTIFKRAASLARPRSTAYSRPTSAYRAPLLPCAHAVSMAPDTRSFAEVPGSADPLQLSGKPAFHIMPKQVRRQCLPCRC